jgi:hypothetical protein
MNEFDVPSLEELSELSAVVKRWRCRGCGYETVSLKKEPPRSCEKCSGDQFVCIVKASTVPASTGFETELRYDNLDSIDEFIQLESDNDTQNRELQIVEKGRR